MEKDPRKLSELIEELQEVILEIPKVPTQHTDSLTQERQLVEYCDKIVDLFIEQNKMCIVLLERLAHAESERFRKTI